MRSKFADRRVSPNVVSESAAMATSLFLRTTTRVVMAAGESKCAPSRPESPGVAPIGLTRLYRGRTAHRGDGSMVTGGRAAGDHIRFAPDQKSPSDPGRAGSSRWPKELHTCREG